MKELSCPNCNKDMKEYVTMFRCRSCGYEYKKIFQIMDESKAREILGTMLNPDNSIGYYHSWMPGMDTFDFGEDADWIPLSSDELEAIVWWMRNKGK